MPNNIQLTRRTVYGVTLQSAQYFKTPMVIKPNSTLNEKFNILQDFEVTNAENLSVKYVCIGNGGLKATVGGNGQLKYTILPHTPRHAALYNHLPFILRLPSNDIPAIERAKYRLRRLETHDNVSYVAYYAKLLDLSNAVTQMELRLVDQDTVISTPFVPTLEDLHPVPPVLTSNEAVITTGNYVAASTNVPFKMTKAEIDEFKEACNIIYGEYGYANITEIGICSGMDTVTTGDFNGTVSSYTEAAGVQVANFAAAGVLCDLINDSIDMTFDVGSNEPLLDIS